MNNKFVVATLIGTFLQSLLLGQSDTYFLNTLVVGQSETYSIEKAPFSNNKQDEFSPVFYKDGIVYCTNISSAGVLNYSSGDQNGLIKIYYVDSLGKNPWQNVRLFSKNLKTKFNDGPVTFTSKHDTIYYSRNILIEGKLSVLSSVRNKLGIFSAVFDGNEWTKIKEFRINDEWYNITTPWISPDGNRLYFASDKSGGFGGSDLYYCQLKDDYWEDPVNLGPVINTKGNESYPYINPAGEFFFSSDGHQGYGGKDIFYSRYVDSTWITPICLDTPINSQYDDFGIATDTLMNEGYFSSNRDGSLDIFHFKTNFQQTFYSNRQKENNYCFTFNDSGLIIIDSTLLNFRWNFGDGKSTVGAIVDHCYPGPGNYNLRLDIIENETGKVFFTKLLNNVEVRDYVQPYINSPDIVIIGDTVEFDALKSYMPGFKILGYSWNLGDGSRSTGARVSHLFKDKGEYFINLELALRSEITGIVKKTGVSKKIIVANDAQDAKSIASAITYEKPQVIDIRNHSNVNIKTLYSAEAEYMENAVFCIQLLSSKTKIGNRGYTFRNLPAQYTLREKFNPVDSNYIYIVDQQMNLMATYPGYQKMLELGFKDAYIKTLVLDDPSEKELHNLIKINGAFADSYFDTADRLTANAFIMLDQIVRLMNKYPSLRLQVAVHSDNKGPADISLALSQKRSQLLVDYLINRGISSMRLVATGFGGSKPIAPNYLEKDRKLNRRIDFIILEQ